MELLILILLKLGFLYTPRQLSDPSADSDPKVIYAHHIIDASLYRYDEDGGVIIEDDVDPNH